MFFELIAALAAGFAAAGLALVARHMIKALPRWLVPVAAAAGLFGMTVFNEYSWAERTMASLPEGMEVVQTAERRSLFRPWSYIWPMTDKFIVVDQAAALRRETQVMADHYFFARWEAVQKVTSVYDCANDSRADLSTQSALDAAGDLQNIAWRSVPQSNAALQLLCAANSDQANG